MIYSFSEKIHETDVESLSSKTLGLNKLETYMLTHN